jgi:hypothetical protein
MSEHEHEHEQDPRSRADEFRDGATESPTNIVREFWDFLKYNKKWWLLPILVLFGLMGLLIVLGQFGLAPFVYPFF